MDGAVGTPPGFMDLNNAWQYGPSPIELVVQTVLSKFFRDPTAGPTGEAPEQSLALVRRSESVFSSSTECETSLMTTTVPAPSPSPPPLPPREAATPPSGLNASSPTKNEGILVRSYRFVDDFVPAAAKETAGRVLRISLWNYYGSGAGKEVSEVHGNGDGEEDIDWERVRLAFAKTAMAIWERTQPGSGTPQASAAFQREELIGGVMQLLKALPRNLTAAELERLRESLPIGLLPDEQDPSYPEGEARRREQRAGAAPPSSNLSPKKRAGGSAMTSKKNSQAAKRRQKRASASSWSINATTTPKPESRIVPPKQKKGRYRLREAIASIIVGLFMVASIIVPYVAVLAAAMVRYEKKHRVAGRFVSGAVRVSREVGRRAATAYLAGDRTVGDVIATSIEWTASDVADGLAEGLTNGIKIWNDIDWDRRKKAPSAGAGHDSDTEDEGQDGSEDRGDDGDEED